MAYDDADNRDMRWSRFVDGDGRVLYVVDAASAEAGDDDAYAYADQGPRQEMRHPPRHGAGDADAGDDEMGDSLSALFLAYDAATDDRGGDAGGWGMDDGDRPVRRTPGGPASRDGSGAAAPGRHAAERGGASRSTRHLTPRRDARRASDPDLAAMSALIDVFDQAESAADAVAPPPRPATAMPRQPRPTSSPPAEHDITITPPRPDETRRWNDAEGVSLAVDDLAAHSPEGEAALDALRLRRAQARRRNGAYAFMAVGVLAVTLVAVFVNYLLGLDEALDAMAGGTATATREDFAYTVDGAGTLEAASTAPVQVSVAGTVMELYVAEGDLVEEGDILFSIENDELMEAATEASARLERANDALRQANAGVTAAYETYNAEVDTYRAGQNPSFNETALLAAIRSAENARDAALAEANAARDALEAANDQAAARDVTAPASGAVTGIHVSVGDKVAPTDAEADVADEAPMRIADVSHLRTVVPMDGDEAQGVVEGQRAQVSLAALPEVTSDAVVSSVSSSTARTSGSGSSVMVALDIPHPDSRLRPGAELAVTITTEVAHDALVVPLSAVRTEEGGSYVWVVTDEAVGLSERRSVTVAGVDEHEGTAMVTDGLAEGEKVGLP